MHFRSLAHNWFASLRSCYKIIIETLNLNIMNKLSNEEQNNNANAMLCDVFNNTVKFRTLKIGQEFECYGDVTINYNYPKICRCIKDSEDSAHEIDGINFFISGSDSVFVNIT